jgi:hypothetical protein
MVKLIGVQATIPEERASEYYTFVAGLHNNGSDPVRTANGVPNERRFSRAAVRRAYEGGESAHFCVFLELLAEHPDEEVPWTDLCAALGMDGRKASGVIGAAAKRLKGKMPYDSFKEGGKYYFVMPAQAAQYVKEIAAEYAEM